MQDLVRKFQAWLAGLSERERHMVTWGGLAAAVLVFLGAIVLPLYTAAARAERRVEQKQQDLEWMRSVAGELRAAGPAGAAGSGQSLIVIVDQSAQTAGLGSAVTGTQPSGTGGVRVRLEGAAFDTVVAWLASLEQQYGLRIESATIDRGAQAGIVNASVILRNSG
ncbi:MAG TPA: type II secretion system protein M [Steroidobacteraceae bacterium]|nr:type II secretion system protein M [Steroidobacteraceae bacterium]